MPELAEYLDQSQERFEDDLIELLRIPSVSTDSRHKADVLRAAEWVAGQFRGMGLEVRIVPTKGHPLVYAESPPVPGKPVALVYGHYDVQPPEPLEKWISPPFEPARREGKIFARGATDDKGQMLTHVKAAQALLESEGRLAVQLKLRIEGEEEIGSADLETLVAENLELLACDVVVVSDTCQFAPGQPAITYGLRGIHYFELRLRGPNRDLHSGMFGGAVANPANVLARLLADLHDDRGRVQLPGFYDDVIPLTPAEREQLAALPFDERRFREGLEVEALAGEAGFTTLERRWARPTCDVNGLWSGYQGEGAKTVLPAEAGAKFSFRLVPNQQPARIAAALRRFLEERIPAGITYELIDYHGAPGMLVPLDSPYLAAASRAIEQGFGKAPVMIREGGSIPIVATLHERLGAHALLLGWGQDDDNPHSPNEKFSLADFHNGIRASACLWQELSRLKPNR